MARRGKGLTGWLLDGGARFVSRAAGKVMSDPRGQDAVARAVGLAQRGRRQVEELQERLMHAAGIPGRQDYQDLAKQLARIKRKTRDLAEKLDARAEEGADEPPEDADERTRH
ncbi:MAG TPA: hypothetical protein VF841_06745 [Anaeromyxobacter sp.]